MLWLLYWLDVIQDFVSELGMKQQMPLVEIRILLIYHVIVMSDIASKEWTGKTIYFNFSSIFGDFFFEIF